MRSPFQRGRGLDSTVYTNDLSAMLPLPGANVVVLISDTPPLQHDLDLAHLLGSKRVCLPVERTRTIVGSPLDLARLPDTIT